MKLSIRKDQRGLGRVVAILILVLLLAAGLVAWRVSQNHDNPAKTANARVAVDSCNQKLNDKDLCKFIGNYDISKSSYLMTINSESKSSPVGANSQNKTIIKAVTTLKSDGKGNSQLSGTSNGQASEVIIFDKVSYMKDPKDGKWWKFASNDAMAPKDTNPVNGLRFNTPSTDSKVTYKKLGKEACGSLNCFKYQIVYSSRPKDINYFWFDTKDYRLQGYYDKAGDDTITDLSIAYQPVTVSAPTPVKEVPAASNTNTQTQLQQFDQNYTGPDTTQ